MKKWLALALIAGLLLFGWVVAGPYLTVNNLREAVKTQDSAALAEQVDFERLRANLRAQFDDYLARRAGPFGAITVRLASGLVGSTVDAMVTPAGIGALMEGRNLWQRVSGQRREYDSDGNALPNDPLRDAEYRFESLSRFTATVHNEDGEPVVFVLTRDGLSWKLSNVRLPLGE